MTPHSQQPKAEAGRSGLVDFSFTGCTTGSIGGQIDDCRLAIDSLASMLCEMEELDGHHLRGISRILEGVGQTLGAINEAIDRADRQGSLP